jgi:hypothetical protein
MDTFGDDIKRHRPTIDAVYDLGLPIHAAHLLHRISEEDGCFPEARLGALLLSSVSLIKDSRSGRKHSSFPKSFDSSPMLSATADYILRHMHDGTAVTPMYRFGRNFESSLVALIKDMPVIRDDRMAVRLICQLTFTVRERGRRSAGLTFQASGLSQFIAREIFHKLFSLAPTDTKGMIARNCLSQLQDPASIEVLLPSRVDSDDVYRAHAAWALGRFRAPGLREHLSGWLSDEENAEMKSLDVLAALKQAIASSRGEATLSRARRAAGVS